MVTSITLDYGSLYGPIVESTKTDLDSDVGYGSIYGAVVGVRRVALPATDNFNRSARSLDGDTMSDGTHIWAEGEGSGCSIAAGDIEVEGDAAGANIQFCSNMLNVADIEVTIKKRGPDCSAVAHYIDSSNYYLAHVNGSEVAQLYRKIGNSFDQLGGDGSAVSDDEEVTIRCYGDDITLLIDGAVDIGPITYSGADKLVRGKAGIRINGTGTVLDDFDADDYVPVAGGNLLLRLQTEGLFVGAI